MRAWRREAGVARVYSVCSWGWARSKGSSGAFSSVVRTTFAYFGCVPWASVGVMRACLCLMSVTAWAYIRSRISRGRARRLDGIGWVVGVMQELQVPCSMGASTYRGDRFVEVVRRKAAAAPRCVGSPATPSSPTTSVHQRTEHCLDVDLYMLFSIRALAIAAPCITVAVQ